MKDVDYRIAILGCTLVLYGCSSMNVWPFGSDDTSVRTSAPANSTEYQCDGGKRFYVRYLDKGTSAWLIYPDREIDLPKSTAGNGTRYSNGTATLVVNGNEATLTDGPAISYTGCKAAGKPN